MAEQRSSGGGGPLATPAALPGEIELPTWKGRLGWEFTDISKLDLAAYERVLPVRTGGHAPIWQLETPKLPDGVIVGELDERAPDALGSLFKDDDDAFVTLCEAGVRGGTYVYVPRGVVVEEPIPIVTVQERDGTFVNQHTLIVVDEGAQAQVWEQYLSGAEELDGMFNVVTEVIVKDGGNLRYVCGQDLSEKSWVFGAQRAHVSSSASLEWVALGFGSRGGRVRMITRIDGEGGDARVTGAYVTRGRQHIDFDTLQEHAALHTSSDLAFRGVLADRSTTVWKGNIIVEPGAQKTDAFQESRNLLLSKRAHADAIPGLEIEANDVRCTHAAAIAQIDPEQLFYLLAHGIDEETARGLVIEGFLAALTERFEHGPTRELLQAAFERRLAEILS